MNKQLAYTIPGYEGIIEEGSESLLKLKDNPSLGEIVTVVLTQAIYLAGFLMIVYIVWGGLHLMISMGDPEGIREGKAKITGGILGFFIVFFAYLILQLVNAIFGLDVTPN
jgi:hypothetical protein